MRQMDQSVELDLVQFGRMNGGVALVTLNRPAVRNAINPDLAQALEQLVERIEDDASVAVAILTGGGDKAFCAGADLREVSAGRLLDCFTAGGGFAGFVNKARSKPWIAAVNGAALAGGFEMVLACDLVIAADHATFGLPEVKRGLIASAGGLYRLPRVLPRAAAMELIATGNAMTAERAMSFGIVNRVTAGSSLIDDAYRFAMEITANAPLAVRESVRIAKLASGFDDPILRADAERTQEQLQTTADYQEGARAFIEKRRPNWVAG